MENEVFKILFEKARRRAIAKGYSVQEADDIAQDYTIGVFNGADPSSIRFIALSSFAKRNGTAGSSRRNASFTYTEINEPLFDDGNSTFENTFRGLDDRDNEDNENGVSASEAFNGWVNIFCTSIGLKGETVLWVKKNLLLSLELKNLKRSILDEEL